MGQTRLQSRLRSLIDASLINAGEGGVTDSATTFTRAVLAGLVADIRGLINKAGLAGGRICLPLDSSLGSLAALIAVLETDASAALIPRPVADTPPDWPPFCDAVLIPPDAVAGIGTAEIIHLSGNVVPVFGQDRVYLRTSGTTGSPKWAVHSTDGLLANARACITRLGLTDSDRVMLPVPFHHMYGLGAGLLPSLLAGASISLVPRGNPLEVFRAQRAFDPTVMFMVPSQCRSIMALNRSAGRARLIVVAGDRLAPDEAAAFEAKHGLIVCLYGSTELGAITAGRPDDPPALRHLTAGPPMDGMTLALDDDQPEDAADGSRDGARDGARAMRVRAKAGLLGYADATGTITAPAPPIWTTGDLVRLHPGDRIEVLGRADHAVNRDGLLVHMGEVEGVLARVGGVAQAAVVAAGQTRRGVGLTAFYTVQRPDAVSADTIMAQCRATLPPRTVPDHLVLLDALPLLASGKVDRRQLVLLAEVRLKS